MGVFNSTRTTIRAAFAIPALLIYPLSILFVYLGKPDSRPVLQHGLQLHLICCTNCSTGRVIMRIPPDRSAKQLALVARQPLMYAHEGLCASSGCTLLHAYQGGCHDEWRPQMLSAQLLGEKGLLVGCTLRPH